MSSLASAGAYNDFSPELRKVLQDKVTSLGKTARFKFNISNPNPDPEKRDGQIIWPMIYTLDPAVFNIKDPYEKREGKPQIKQVALVDKIDERGMPSRFTKVRVPARSRGEVLLDLENNPEHIEQCMFLLIHPKMEGGMFYDKTVIPKFRLVNEAQEAKQEREVRSAKKKATDKAETLNLEEVREFAAAMNWESEEEEDVLRNQIELFAETEPEVFNGLYENGNIKVRAEIKRAIDNRVWGYDPSSCKLSELSTSKTIVELGLSAEGKTDFERFAEWFVTNGKLAEEHLKKLRAASKQGSLV